MKYLSFCLVLLAIAIVRAENGNAIDKQPSFLESLFSSYTKSVGQERATNERTLKDYITYQAIQSILLNALKPKPIVDTATALEKNTPNFGGKMQFLGDLVVKGSETFSKALNSVLDVPKQAALKLSAGATQALNQLGAYIVGL